MGTGTNMKNHIFLYIAFTCIVTAIGLAASESPKVVWNGRANSRIIGNEELAQMELPSWKARQMVWPGASEVESKSVSVDDGVKGECKEWIAKFVAKDFLPDDWERHLTAMKNWGLIRQRSKQEKLCDVFLLRFKKGRSLVHLQESGYDVVITVTDELSIDEGHSDLKAFVLETADTILADPMKPDATSAVRVFERGGPEKRMARVIWYTKAVQHVDETGRRILSLIEAEKNGAIAVDVETDGRFISFHIVKYGGGPRLFLDPYKERFGPRGSS